MEIKYKTEGRKRGFFFFSPLVCLLQQFTDGFEPGGKRGSGSRKRKWEQNLSGKNAANSPYCV